MSEKQLRGRTPAGSSTRRSVGVCGFGIQLRGMDRKVLRTSIGLPIGDTPRRVRVAWIPEPHLKAVLEIKTTGFELSNACTPNELEKKAIRTGRIFTPV